MHNHQDDDDIIRELVASLPAESEREDVDKSMNHCQVNSDEL